MPDQRQLQFADFALDIESGDLRRNGRVVALERQPALVLARLVTSAGQLVTRDDLAATIWGTATHVNFDDGLNYCIRQIRAALGDDPKSPRFIATIPRRGYRFIATVTATPEPGRRLARRRGSRPAWRQSSHSSRWPSLDRTTITRSRLPSPEAFTTPSSRGVDSSSRFLDFSFSHSSAIPQPFSRTRAARLASPTAGSDECHYDEWR